MKINIKIFSLMVFTLLYGSFKNVYAITKMLPSVIEIVYSGSHAEQDKLLDFFNRQQHIDTNDIYQWQNHFVIYGLGYEHLLPKIKATFKHCAVKFYSKPFYDFERSRCNSKQVSARVDNIILTANLVADPELQQQYLNYHKTQFKNWPEVSNGFCNASFQRLLVFKSGRQLMLVISIPQGDNLDKLNPLTTQNNPRVNDWNNLMKKYQEGIPGTKQGEVWVFLKPYNQKNHINHL